MNWDAVQAVAELVAAFGVFISLVYLARQVQGSSLQTRESAVQALSHKLQDLPMAVAASRELSSVFRRGLAGLEALDGEDERSQFTALLLAITSIYEEMFYSWRRDLVEPWMWTSITNRLRDIVGTPGFAAWWETRTHWFSSEFREFLTPQVTRTSSVPPRVASPSRSDAHDHAG